MSKVDKTRFLNIDALRGIAAFLVVLVHLKGEQLKLENFSLNEIFYFFASFGYSGVYLFFVISGFCIHLRWAKSYSKGNINPEIDFKAFWKRRWIRLYPAYLAAILLFLGLEYFQGKITFNSFFVWDVVSHILMIHNLDNRTVYSINIIFWTLAIEEQLYLIYFLLLKLRQKFGWCITLFICFISRFLWLVFVLIFNRLNIIEVPFAEGAFANWWIWALGALGIESYLRIIELPKWCYSNFLSISFLFLAAFLHFSGTLYPASYFLNRLVWVFEPLLWGIGFFLLINSFMEFEGKLNNAYLIKKMISFCALLGIFSYSLYLTHHFIIHIFKGLNHLFIVVIASVFAYIFYLIFEKPLMDYLAKQK